MVGPGVGKAKPDGVPFPKNRTTIAGRCAGQAVVWGFGASGRFGAMADMGGRALTRASRPDIPYCVMKRMEAPLFAESARLHLRKPAPCAAIMGGRHYDPARRSG
jgi:hypothetical protein